MIDWGFDGEVLACYRRGYDRPRCGETREGPDSDLPKEVGSESV